ncbi:hypothetical protein AGLY_016137 [Aphis glycines]|uniref:Uncharacterized protein n=1 Tax=Aphis glycines TaxID=307491 RepID=A0A6G0SZQ9_APHGL|nr:hypothetical protein AGLY_016137 [Aphis glycines]
MYGCAADDNLHTTQPSALDEIQIHPFRKYLKYISNTFKKYFKTKTNTCHLVYQIILNNNNSKKAGKWVPLCCTLGTVWITIIYYRSVKFESNDIQWMLNVPYATDFTHLCDYFSGSYTYSNNQLLFTFLQFSLGLHRRALVVQEVFSLDLLNFDRLLLDLNHESSFQHKEKR